MKPERLPYPDICKLFAIFAITWAHCAQYISGLNWTHFLGGTGVVHAFSMPLFFMLSGWFLNTDKLRSINLWSYFVSKFKRLIIPAYVWSMIYCIFTFQRPDLTHLIYFNWYVKALFVCLIIIVVAVKLLKNDVVCAVVSSAVVLLMPMSNINNVNFMFPFMWGGHFLRRYIESSSISHATMTARFCLVLGVAMLFCWTPAKTVYECPFKITSLDTEMVYNYLYRFFLGFSLSIAIIYFIMRNADKKWLRPLANYGQCSLVIYLFSFVFNGFFALWLNHFDIHTNKYVLLDILALVLCLLIMVLSVKLYKKCKKYKWSSLLLLGEA